MRICKITIENFRGIKRCDILVPENAAFVGDNNAGKSTILEAIDLVLGPERLSRYPAIDEHDFYAGEYINNDGDQVSIKVEIVIIGLSDEQQRHFRDNIEWWDLNCNSIVEEGPPSKIDREGIVSALRVGFQAFYDGEEDDFVARTYFASPVGDEGDFRMFGTRDKRRCGFLFLRTLRTGARALSLERGSLLDVILRLRELRPRMWEDVLGELRELQVANDPELGIDDVLTSVATAVESIVPFSWGTDPHMKVSQLTRTDLRRVLTVFMGTGAKNSDCLEYAAPFNHQGTGTINVLVLSLLSLIAELRQNVIFAMEEPEIAIPPYTQKRIVESVTSKSSQALFTSHSPYVLEEFDPSQVLVVKRDAGVLTTVSAGYPPQVKHKAYRQEFRQRFCEALLAPNVLIVEGRTEYDTILGTSRRMNELAPDKYKTLHSLGVAVLNAGSDSKISVLAQHFNKLGKRVFTMCDQQTLEQRRDIETNCLHMFEAPEKGLEDVILQDSCKVALSKYAFALVDADSWPSHLMHIRPRRNMNEQELMDSLRVYFTRNKGEGAIADFLSTCSIKEMPVYITDMIVKIGNILHGGIIFRRRYNLSTSYTLKGRNRSGTIALRSREGASTRE